MVLHLFSKFEDDSVFGGRKIVSRLVRRFGTGPTDHSRRPACLRSFWLQQSLPFRWMDCTQTGAAPVPKKYHILFNGEGVCDGTGD